ncbi:MAG: two pore domain potassium channel family protein [Rhodospirillales bacterium]|nr:two pore domain potassium channel family protein [Acetobacter sp.]
MLRFIQNAPPGFYWIVTGLQTLFTGLLYWWFLNEQTQMNLGLNLLYLLVVTLFYFVPLPAHVARQRWPISEVILFVWQTIVTMLFILVAYAAVYSARGLIACYQVDELGKVTNNPAITHDRFNALYFSAITWTTIGYGDFLPTPGLCRFYAASEALAEYMLLGTFVSVLIIAFQKLDPKWK